MTLKAVVMAGGQGTRLRPLTCNLPKPMVPVANRPILEHVLDQLSLHGFDEALLTLHHMPQAIRERFGERTPRGLRLRHYVEEVPLGTAGSVKNVEPELDGTFLVISGDVLSDIDLSALVDFHRKRGAAVTIGLTAVESPLEYGVVICRTDGRITRFLEKPSWGEVFSDQVNTGIYVIEPEVLKLFEAGRVFDFSQNLFPLLLEAGSPIFGHAPGGYWCDVGTLAQYLQAHVDILEGRTGFEIGGSEYQDKVWVGPGVDIAPGVELTGPLLIGPGTYIGTGARVEGPATLGREVVVGGQASVKRSVIGDHSQIGRLAEVRGAVLGRGVRLQSRASVFDGAVLADEVRVGEEAVVKPGVKVWPGRHIAPETVLGDSLVWGRAWGYGVFGEAGVRGTVNVDICAETAARVGAVFGASRKAGARVVVGIDPGAAPRLLRGSLTAGLGLAGCKAWNIGELPAVVVRHAVGVLGAEAGVHIGLAEGEMGGDGGGGAAPGGPTSDGLCAIRFFGAGGHDISRGETRRLERDLGGEDFRRATADRLGETRFFPGLGEAYVAHLSQRGWNLARKGLTVVGAHQHPWLEEQAPGLWRGLDVAHIPFRPPAETEELGKVIRRYEAALGFVVNESGEVVTLFDNRGRLLSKGQAWLVLSTPCLVRDGTPLVVPSDLPRAVGERMAALGARPVPCRATRAETMARMAEVEKEAGPAIFRQSEMIYGGLLAVVGLLDYLADTGYSVAEMVDESPLGEWVHLRVPCPWEMKGRVMRLLLEERSAGEEPVTGGEAGVEARAEETLRREPAVAAGVSAASGPVEGMQAESGEGRVLVLPDGERPAFHIYSEAASMEIAEELAAFYSKRVKELAGLEEGRPGE